MNLLHAHGSPTNYQYQHGCRCVACRGAKSDYSAAYKADHREERHSYDAAYHQAHKKGRNAYRAAYYQDHREEKSAYDVVYRADHGDALHEKKAKEFAAFTEWLQILRTNNGCEDCQTHEGRLEHHHVDPATKRYDISRMYHRSLDVLEDELEKCVVLCVPCHNKRHVAMRLEWKVSV